MVSKRRAAPWLSERDGDLSVCDPGIDFLILMFPAGR